MKICIDCGALKPIDNFYNQRGMSDGKFKKCKECVKKNVIENRLKNIDYYRNYDRARGNRQTPEYLKEWREKYPKKYKAHNLVNNSIRDGKLFKLPCEKCSSENVHAHHDDYAKPLNIRWLCPVHHKQWHDENGEGLNSE